MRNRSVSAGFTLIELMVVLTVLAVLQALAAPALSSLANSMRLTSAVNSFFSSLLLARSEAIKRNSRVVVCKSVSGDACIKTGGWEQGWIVFHDVDNDALRDTDEAILSREQALRSPLRFTGNSPLASYVSYTPMGQTAYASGAFQAGTLSACLTSISHQEARHIVISSTGRPRTARAIVESCPSS